MKIYLIAGWLLAAAVPGLGESPGPLPWAAHGQPPVAPADVRVLVDVIPASASFVLYVNISANKKQLDPVEAPRVGEGLSRTVGQLQGLARQRGANLLVLLGSEHGVPITIKQAAEPLRLRPNDPSLTAILYRWDASAPIGLAESKVRFVSALPVSARSEAIEYKISPANGAVGSTNAFWVYANLSRLVADAVAHGFDRIFLSSTTDSDYESLALPGCDARVRVSFRRPEVDVLIFNGAKKSDLPKPPPSRVY